MKTKTRLFVLFCSTRSSLFVRLRYYIVRSLWYSSFWWCQMQISNRLLYFCWKLNILWRLLSTWKQEYKIRAKMTFNIDIDSSWTILQVQDKPKILAFKWESKNSQKKKSVSWFLFSLLLYYWVVIPTPFSSNWFSCLKLF